MRFIRALEFIGSSVAAGGSLLPKAKANRIFFRGKIQIPNAFVMCFIVKGKEGISSF